MKYILTAIIALGLSTPAFADNRHHNHYSPYVYNQHKHSHKHDKWVVPLIGGVILGAVINEANKPKTETIIVEKIVKQKCEPVTIIVQDQWGRTVEKRREERCVTVY